MPLIAKHLPVGLTIATIATIALFEALAERQVLLNEGLDFFSFFIFLPAILWLICVGFSRNSGWFSWVNLTPVVIFYGVILGSFVLSFVSASLGCNLNEGGVDIGCAIGGKAVAEILMTIFMYYLVLAYGGIIVLYGGVISWQIAVIAYRLFDTYKSAKNLKKSLTYAR